MELTCRKSARSDGAKHISKAKCAKHHMSGPLLDIPMSFSVTGARDGAFCRKSAKREGFIAALLQHTTLQVQLPLQLQQSTTVYNYNYSCNYNNSYKYTTLNYTTYIALHSLQPHYTTTTLQLQLQLQQHIQVQIHYIHELHSTPLR